MDHMSKANLRHSKGNLDLITTSYVLGTNDQFPLYSRLRDSLLKQSNKISLVYLVNLY
jgi:hypothetical protein